MTTCSVLRLPGIWAHLLQAGPHLHLCSKSKQKGKGLTDIGSSVGKGNDKEKGKHQEKGKRQVKGKNKRGQ